MNTEREQLIRDFANDEWVDRITNEFMGDDEFELLSEEWDRKLDDFLASCTSGEELHYLADYWNWDNGVETLLAVAGHPFCEKATALLIYWRTQPGYYTDMDEDEVPGYLKDVYDLSKFIQRRYVDNVYATGSCTYDPSREVKGLSEIRDKGVIPDQMFTPV